MFCHVVFFWMLWKPSKHFWLFYHFLLIFPVSGLNAAETIFTKLVKSSSLLVKLLIQFLNSFSNILQRASIACEIYHIWRITVNIWSLIWHYTIKYLFARCAYYFIPRDKIRLEFWIFLFPFTNRFAWPVATQFITIRRNIIRKNKTVLNIIICIRII